MCAKLIDCGIAVLIDADQAEQKNAFTMTARNGGRIGTAAYMCRHYLRSGKFGEHVRIPREQ
jgi:hypothetical protein